MAELVADPRGTAGPRFRLPGLKNGKLASLAFLAPGAIWLLALVIYPIIATARYSLLNESATKFVGLDNYKAIFSTAAILTTFRNNAIWVIVFPFMVTVIGLIMAVLTERIRWSTAFKAVIVMPVVFSATTSALIFRTIFDIDPHVGAVNALIQTVGDWVHSPGAYPTSTTGQPVSALVASGVKVSGGGLISTGTVRSGQAVQLGMIGISPDTLALLHARPAARPAASSGAVNGVVWRDFSISHPSARGRIFSDEDGLPDLRISLVSASGASVSSATTNSRGQFTLATPKGGGPYRVSIDASNFSNPATGPVWLGTGSLTPTSGLSGTAQALLSVPLIDLAMIIAYLWMWSGFAMIIIGAGLAALNPEVLEAARTEGAREWQVFRRITVPMLSPVLIVVFVTMVINVLKVFDIILNMAPGSSQAGASTLALEMYNEGFSGGIHSGLSSAIAVILFLLVVPAMLFNLRRLRQ
ncbi:MAG TPA: sugar ABC transporter permease [Solirubrobacteraceae bacterium]|nr:sugar ABC transporter permease [Solirubrobacteraceae bacterium]